MADKLSQILKRVTLALLYILIYLGLQTVLFLFVEISGGDILNYTGIVAIVSALASMAIYSVVFYLRDKKITDVIRFKRLSLIDAVFSVSMALGFRLITAAYMAWCESIPWINEILQNEANGYYFNTMTDLSTLTLALAVCVIGPLTEEILYRGLVYNELKGVMPVWMAILFQAVSFGVSHGSVIQAVFSAIFGIIFGIIYHKTKNISVIVLIHCIFNLSVMLEINIENGIMPIFISGMMLTAISVCLFFYVYRKKSLHTKDENVGGNNNG